MPCYHPVSAWRGPVRSDGKRPVVFRPRAVMPADAYMEVPCGKCVGCVLEKARQWAMRCNDEAALWSESSFVTLTFDDIHVRGNRSVDTRFFQLWMKRFRKFTGRDDIRYFACGEYGPLNGRVHYHILFFNVGFPDRVYLKTTPSGEKIYTSPSLQSVWKYGFSSVGDVTPKSAAYVARYNLKKVESIVAKVQYLDRETGEVLAPERVWMSRGGGPRAKDSRCVGGIGSAWIRRFQSDVYPRGVRVQKGVDNPSCRFYDSFYEKVDPVGYSRLKLERDTRRVARAEDNTPRRLLDKEFVKLQQIKLLQTAKEV